MRNPILIGQAEEIDLVLPQVRRILAAEGIYIGRDRARPEYTIPLSVQGGKVFSMAEDTELDPERFLSTVEFHGPYFGDPSAGEHGRLERDAARYRKLRAATVAVVREGPEVGPDWEMELAVAETPEDFDAVVDSIPECHEEGKA